MYFILIGPFCFGLFVFHSALEANILFGTKYFCLYIRSGTVRLQEPALFPKHVIVIAVRDRSAPEPVLFRNELFSVYGPGPFGARFCLKTSIGVCGPRPFGSGILFFVWNEFFVGSSQGAGFFFFFGVKYYCMRSWPARLRDPVLVIYAVRNRFALGAG